MLFIFDYYIINWLFLDQRNINGKGPYDGIGGTIKREASYHCLQQTTSGFILSAKDLFEWGLKHLTGIQLFFVSTSDIVKDCTLFKLDDRFSKAKTIVGTRNYHAFIPD